MKTKPTYPVPRLKRMVEMTLEENPKWRNIEVRNSDIALMVVIWQRWYSVGTNDDSVVHLYRLLDLPREDNIKRVRAYFQNTEHKYLPTNPDILIKRGIEAEYWQEALGYRLTKEEWQRHHERESELSKSIRRGDTELTEVSLMSDGTMEAGFNTTPHADPLFEEPRQLGLL